MKDKLICVAFCVSVAIIWFGTLTVAFYVLEL